MARLPSRAEYDRANAERAEVIRGKAELRYIRAQTIISAVSLIFTVALAIIGFEINNTLSRQASEEQARFQQDAANLACVNLSMQLITLRSDAKFTGSEKVLLALGADVDATCKKAKRHMLVAVRDVLIQLTHSNDIAVANDASRLVSPGTPQVKVAVPAGTDPATLDAMKADVQAFIRYAQEKPLNPRSSDIARRTPRLEIGRGTQWESPFGPMRIDFGRAMTSDDLAAAITVEAIDTGGAQNDIEKKILRRVDNLSVESVSIHARQELISGISPSANELRCYGDTSCTVAYNLAALIRREFHLTTIVRPLPSDSADQRARVELALSKDGANLTGDTHVFTFNAGTQF